MVFDKDWFNQHQTKLIWLLNNRFTRRWFRYVLRIDCKETINYILPHAYWYGAKKKGSDIEVTADFRTHEKYAKRLYYAFRPLWWAMHLWDFFADVYMPRLSFGFLTLTVYPNANPETTSVDGWTSRESASSWASLRGGAGTNFGDDQTDGNTVRFRTSGTTNWDALFRGIILFDTSALTSSATVSAATFSIYGFSKTDNLSITPNVAVVSSNPASNTALAASDFTTLGTTDYATRITYASFSTTGYNDFALNASGISAISKTGVSKFGVRNGQYDLDNSAPTHPGVDSISSDIRIYFADQAGTTNDPKLVITYSTGPAAGFYLTLLGVG